jgi:hypothetical protein
MVAKLALPMTRLSMMRPATLTSTGVASSSSAVLLAVDSSSLPAVFSREEIVGEGLALGAPASQLLAALGDDLVLVLGQRGLFAHGRFWLLRRPVSGWLR